MDMVLNIPICIVLTDSSDRVGFTAKTAKNICLKNNLHLIDKMTLKYNNQVIHQTMENLNVFKHFEMLTQEDEYFEKYQGDVYGFKKDIINYTVDANNHISNNSDLSNRTNLVVNGDG